MLSCRPARCAPVLLALFALTACAEREVPIVETQGSAATCSRPGSAPGPGCRATR